MIEHQEYVLPRRSLGHTGLDVSVLGLGGFHQVETEQETLNAIVDRYLAVGGNYVETARGYGKGASEEKLGHALKGRREEVILASKTGAGSRDRVWEDLEQSLAMLQTDHLDVLFFHGINNTERLDGILAAEGALKGFCEAQDQGVIRHIGMSSHWPPMYLESAKRLPLDVVLIWGSYLEFCNFPVIPGEVLPDLRERGIGILFMKPLADGFLHGSPRDGFRYALAQECDCAVSGFNSLEMLETDLAVCCDETPVMRDELLRILREAPELGNYVCRQCADCPVSDDSELLKCIFELEGYYDRQMDDRRPVDADEHDLRERLKGWFGLEHRAQELYAGLGEAAIRLAASDLRACPYGLDIQRKLKIVHAKLSSQHQRA